MAEPVNSRFYDISPQQNYEQQVLRESLSIVLVVLEMFRFILSFCCFTFKWLATREAEIHPSVVQDVWERGDPISNSIQHEECMLVDNYHYRRNSIILSSNLILRHKLEEQNIMNLSQKRSHFANPQTGCSQLGSWGSPLMPFPIALSVWLQYACTVTPVRDYYFCTSMVNWETTYSVISYSCNPLLYWGRGESLGPVLLLA